MSKDVSWQLLLREALTVLALPSDEQVQANGPGCVTCDLFEDFGHARTVPLGNTPGLSEKQRKLLDRIDASLRGMQEADLECSNDEAIRRPAWQQLRELAAEVLRAFGWEGFVVRPLVEVQPGVWQRLPSEGNSSDPLD